jgi:hypothetical protein
LTGGVLAGMTGFGIAVLGRPETEEQHQRYASENVLLAYCLRTRDVIKEYRDVCCVCMSACSLSISVFVLSVCHLACRLRVSILREKICKKN